MSNIFDRSNNIIYKKENNEFKILSIILISVPNGELYQIYRDKIIGASKNKGEAFRYNYIQIPYFKLLEKNPNRVRLLFKDTTLSEKDIFGFFIEKRTKKGGSK